VTAPSPLTIAPESPRAPEILRLIAELDAHVSSLYPPESNNLLEVEALCAPNVFFVVARLGGEAVGCGGVRVEDGYAEVKRMYVLPRMRGRKIGMAIMLRLEEHARAEGITRLRLETGISQPEALGLYRRLGFLERGAFGAYASDPLCVFMEKSLV
jgi:putative acetyltransferase